VDLKLYSLTPLLCVAVFDFHQEADGMEESGRGQKKFVVLSTLLSP